MQKETIFDEQMNFQVGHHIKNYINLDTQGPEADDESSSHDLENDDPFKNRVPLPGQSKTRLRANLDPEEISKKLRRSITGRMKSNKPAKQKMENIEMRGQQLDIQKAMAVIQIQQWASKQVKRRNFLQDMNSKPQQIGKRSDIEHDSEEVKANKTANAVGLDHQQL